MKQIYTEDDVVRYVYGEMDDEEYPVFFEVLCKDAALWQMYESLQQLKTEMGDTLHNPSEATCLAIMEEVNRLALDIKASNAPVKSTPKLQPRFALFPAGLVFGLFIASAGFTLQHVYFNSERAQTAQISADDHAWMYERLYRMEDDRVLPEMTGADAYRLVRYSNQNYANESLLRFE